MPAIEFKKACIRFNPSFSLLDINWRVEPGEIWAIMGPSGAGKSALAAALSGAGQLLSGERNGIPSHAGMVTMEAQAELIERERLRDDSDLTDRINEGTPVREILEEVSVDQSLLDKLIGLFGLEPLLDRSFRKLSTGETRKVLFTRALTSRPDFLVIDCPFEGLDAQTVPLISRVLENLAREIPMLLVINRMDELPEYVTHVALVNKGRLETTLNTGHRNSVERLSRYFHLHSEVTRIPPPDQRDDLPALPERKPLVDIQKATIRYTDNTVFENLDWRIEPGQHWQLTGPNGSGKTSLLNLITGDHPQCYTNDIYVCGFQRGSGESIWDIKQYIGYVSSALLWDYRVSINCRNVIISGFFDSIGVYTQVSQRQKDIADQWLQLIGFKERATLPFDRLSSGDKRLLLIARAMVKHPALLILDEPCAALDDMSRQLVLALIEKICAGSESTVIYVNHHAQDRIRGIDNYLAL